MTRLGQERQREEDETGKKEGRGETDTKERNMPRREKAENKLGLKANRERERKHQK